MTTDTILTIIGSFLSLSLIFVSYKIYKTAGIKKQIQMSKKTHTISLNEKGMKAKQLLTYLQDLENHGIDLENVDVNFREDYDSDVIKVNHVAEDLYDEETNSVLESIVLTNKDE